jgi:hypothetical protein
MGNKTQHSRLGIIGNSGIITAWAPHHPEPNKRG